MSESALVAASAYPESAGVPDEPAAAAHVRLVYSARARHIAEIAILLVMLTWGANVEIGRAHV
jgi:hypothetical protein